MDSQMKHSPVCSDHLGLELVYLALGCLRELHIQAHRVQENQDSEEVLQYCGLYDVFGYDRYILLDFKIAVNSLAAGRDMQISEDTSFELEN